MSTFLCPSTTNKTTGYHPMLRRLVTSLPAYIPHSVLLQTVACATACSLSIAGHSSRAHAMMQDSTRFHVEVTGNGAGGNSSFFVVGGSLTFQHLEDSAAYEFMSTVRGGYGVRDDRVIAKNYGLAFNLDARPQSRVSPFAFSSFEHDYIRRLDLMAKFGIGAKLIVMDSTDLKRKIKKDKMSISAAALFEYERQTINTDSVAHQEGILRLSLRAKKDIDVKSVVTLGTTWFWQPKFKEWNDYLVDGTVRLTCPIASGLSAIVDYRLIFDSEHPPDIRGSDHRYRLGIRGEF